MGGFKARDLPLVCYKDRVPSGREASKTPSPAPSPHGTGDISKGKSSLSSEPARLCICNSFNLGDDAEGPHVAGDKTEAPRCWSLAGVAQPGGKEQGLPSLPGGLLGLLQADTSLEPTCSPAGCRAVSPHPAQGAGAGQSWPEAGDAGWGSLRRGSGHIGTHSAQTLQYHTRAVSSTLGDQPSKGPALRGSKNWPLWADKETETQHGRVCPEGTGQSQDLDLDPSSSSLSSHFSALSHTRQADSVRDPFLRRREP